MMTTKAEQMQDASASIKYLIAWTTLWLMAACAAAQSNDATSAAMYDTQLFNLVLDQNSPVDGKNHYQPKFDTAFNAMLAQSALAKRGNPGVSLRKRLLSGPQPDAIILRNKGGGQSYVYYEACQAHTCDATRLAVLYAPASNTMLGKLHLDGKDEYLGNPDASERKMLDGPATTPPAAIAQPSALMTIIDALADIKAFRMTSTQFDAVVAPYCKKVRGKNFKPMILATYHCAPNAGITEIKMDAREGFGSPLPNYMMTISVDFAIDNYAAVRAQVEKKLGRGKSRGKDFIEWRHTADKALNEAGNPVINLSRDSSDRSASLHVALEQGP
jgi:hypothetical protein